MFDLRKAASRFRFKNLFKDAIGLATKAVFAGNAAKKKLLSSVPTTGRNTRRRRYYSPETTGNSIPLRKQYRGTTEIRILVRSRKSLRKASQAENIRSRYLGSDASTSTSPGTPEVCVLALEFTDSECTKSEDDFTSRTFSSDNVAATNVSNPVLAREDSSFDWSNPEKFEAELERERRRMESRIKEAKKERERDAREKERGKEKERQQEMEMEEIRRIHQARLQETKERNAANARRQEEERAKLAAEERNRAETARRGRAPVEKKCSSHLLNQGRKTPVESEGERIALWEEEVGLFRELEVEGEFQAWSLEADEARLAAEFQANENLLNDFQLMLDAGQLPEELEQMFRDQEKTFFATTGQTHCHHTAQEQLQFWQEQQALGVPQGSQDVPMGEPLVL